MNCTRRQFLEILAASGFTIISLEEPAFADTGLQTHSRKTYGLLNDGTRCIGCHSCENACREYNGLPELEKGPEGEIIYPTKLDANTFTRVEIRTITSDENPSGEKKIFRRHMCNHCEHPSCASACPVGALTKSPEGPVYYRSERCIGCRYCINACPFSVPKYMWDSPKPFVRKCTMCHDKVINGEPTSCASVCPAGAIKFGYREDLIEEARQRISADPERYQDYIFGEKEVGGTSVLYLSTAAISLEEFGFPMEVGTESYPSLTWAALSRVPGIALYVVFWVSLVYFITHRRIPEEIKRQEALNKNREEKS